MLYFSDFRYTTGDSKFTKKVMFKLDDVCFFGCLEKGSSQNHVFFVKSCTVPQVNSIPWKSCLKLITAMPVPVMRADFWGAGNSPLQTTKPCGFLCCLDVELIQSYCINWVFMIDDVISKKDQKSHIFVGFSSFCRRFCQCLTELFLQTKTCPSLPQWLARVISMARRLLVFQSQPWQRLAFGPRAWIWWWDCFASFAFP